MGTLPVFIPGIFGRKRLLSLLTVLACAVTTALPLYWYRQFGDAEDFQQRYELSFALPENDPQYRWCDDDNVLMISGNNAGVAAFSSTLENSSYRFDTLLGFYRKNGTGARMEHIGVPELLGGKYSLVPYSELTGEERDVRPIEGSDHVVVSSPACPIGFACEGYITEREFGAVANEDKPQLLMRYICLPDGISPEGLRHVSAAPEELPSLSESIGRCVRSAVSDFSRSSRGFSCTTDYDESCPVWFSVPYSPGWSARIDGEELTILDSAGMMAVIVPTGHHSLSFVYRTPLYLPGLACSALGLLLLGFTAVYEKKRKK